ncbi:hypothetical protein F5J12DRAFT_906284 [Pisolithus orientalis]|uniref:uncharacterized protein n=1 Tax=Pisolithus orientalis TaxID=936130 RepID=UPI0022259288|nr:uncharacterized protein F5J12DRAFT_906284 [Pisolithus orientalis]KAI6002385.1 hypothetical protein F5J12DRAFT_906284 [Pisolithus orientalis]
MDFALEGIHVLVTGASDTSLFLCTPDLTDGQKPLGANVIAHYNIKFEPLGGLLKTFPNNLQRSIFASISKGNVGLVQAVKHKAAIVLVGSTTGKYGEAGHADYAASKCGILTMTLKNKIARVNCVAPRWVINCSLATTPLKKIATLTDIANQIAVLRRRLSGHVTGLVLMVEGGMGGCY